MGYTGLPTTERVVDKKNPWVTSKGYKLEIMCFGKAKKEVTQEKWKASGKVTHISASIKTDSAYTSEKPSAELAYTVWIVCVIWPIYVCVYK